MSNKFKIIMELFIIIICIGVIIVCIHIRSANISGTNEYASTTDNESLKYEDTYEYHVLYESDSADYIGDYTSNINIDEDGIATTDLFVSWFTMDNDDEIYYGVYQYIIYAINEYYAGSIPCNFHCSIPDYIHDELSNMIFEVTVYGDDRIINIQLDMITPAIHVEEIE